MTEPPHIKLVAAAAAGLRAAIEAKEPRSRTRGSS